MALKLLWIFILTDLSIGVSFSDSVLFRFSIDGILFRVLSDRNFFRVRSKRCFSWVIIALFPPYRYFLSNCDTIFFNQKQMFCFTFTIFSKAISWTCLVTSAKLVAKNWMKKYLHGKDTKYYIENICHQFPDSWMCSQCYIENILCAINFPIYICHQIPDEYIVQKQLPTCNFI